MNDTQDRPLIIRFDPPAYLQRRALILANLKQAQTPCRSLLDIGTGDGGLLAYLVPCDDALPLTSMTGVDPNSQEIQLAVINTKPSDQHKHDLRWRPLNISLYHSGVAALEQSDPVYDCITAIEVLEHLDPPDVEALTRVCLGHLKPNLFIVTTPNRDFNPVFARLDGPSGLSYYRKGIAYPMRHDDHRFELSRIEFESWAKAEAQKYEYSVIFTGVGSVENAFSGQSNWRETFAEKNLSTTFGFSTQAAVFTRTALVPTRLGTENLWGSNPLATHEYPWSDQDGYPPTEQKMRELVLQAETFFSPAYDAANDYGDRLEHFVMVNCRELFDSCYMLQRICRFQYEVFLLAVRRIEGTMIREQKVEDEYHVRTDSMYGTAGDQVELQPRLLMAEIICVEERISVKYTFDMSPFLAKQDLGDDSISAISGEWDNEVEVAPSIIGEWDQTGKFAIIQSHEDTFWDTA